MADKKILELTAKPTPADTDAIVVQEAGGAPGSTKYSLLASLWTWAKAKADLLYATTGHDHTGIYEAAGTAAAEIGDHDAAYPHTDIALNTLARHTHANLALLGTYDQTNVNLSDAVTKKHTHANSIALAQVSGTNTGDEVVFTGAGAAGLVPNPLVAAGKYLRDDGSWQTIVEGAATQAFGTVTVAGQANVVADAAPDTLTISAGTNVQITTDATSDTVTIAAAHDHDMRYYTEAEVDTALAGKSNTAHTHTSVGVSDFTEAAQDAVGGILTDTSTVNLTYDDGNGVISAEVIVAGLSGIAQSAITNLTTDLAAKEPAQTAASQAEAEAGAQTALRSFSPLRIGQGIQALKTRVATFSPSAGAVTVDWDSADHARVTITEATTFTFSNGRDGQRCLLEISQDGTGGRTATMPGAVAFGTDITAMPALSVGASKKDYFLFVKNSTSYHLCAYARGY